MKKKTILVGLNLLVLIFCSANLSQAALDPSYYYRMLAPPSEHPWQHDDNPGMKDDFDHALSPFVIFSMYPTIKTIFISIHNHVDPKIQARELQKNNSIGK